MCAGFATSSQGSDAAKARDEQAGSAPLCRPDDRSTQQRPIKSLPEEVTSHRISSTASDYSEKEIDGKIAVQCTMGSLHSVAWNDFL